MPGKTKAYRRGFTLLEVNLAVFIMSTGILAICALYSLGFRENRQSVEDVAGAAFAELYLSPLVQGLSATNMPWSAWAEIGDEPSRSATRSQNVADGVWPRSGWRDYVQPIEDTRQLRYRVGGGAAFARRLGMERGERQIAVAVQGYEAVDSVRLRVRAGRHAPRDDRPACLPQRATARDADDAADIRDRGAVLRQPGQIARGKYGCHTDFAEKALRSWR